MIREEKEESDDSVEDNYTYAQLLDSNEDLREQLASQVKIFE